MRILFVLPAPVRVPSGGAAVVYQHARGLVERGHEVAVAAPAHGGGVKAALRASAVRVVNRVQGILDRPLLTADGVDTLELATPRDLDASAYDSVIATGFQTAPWVHRAMEGRGRGRVYFIQHDERHLSSAAEATWALPFVRVTIATWLKGLLETHGAPVEAVVPNAVNKSVFRVIRPLADRASRVVSLYHRLPVKGPDVLVETLERLRADVPTIEADVVTARAPQHRLPSWVNVHLRPTLDELVRLYNRAGVCLHTSRLEGWGLVPMEAAACGCAVVATASRGVAEYLTAGQSMREVPVGDPIALAAEAVELLTSPQRRVQIAEAGIRDVSRFAWPDSTQKLESVLLDSA